MKEDNEEFYMDSWHMTRIGCARVSSLSKSPASRSIGTVCVRNSSWACILAALLAVSPVHANAASGLHRQTVLPAPTSTQEQGPGRPPQQQAERNSAGNSVREGSPSALQTGDTAEMRAYIRQGWNTLSRSLAECSTLGDSKLRASQVLYLPFGMEQPEQVKALVEKCGIRVASLPKKIEKIGDLKPEDLPQPGLLYLPNPYVVPGGRFNEMYGWDSYFIIRGLVRDGRSELARGMVENFFFEIKNYGGILNANRTYYLTRSQPPLLTSMILAIFNGEQVGNPAQNSAKKELGWLRRAHSYAVRDYGLWTREPHLAGSTGLARYFDVGEGPVPEMGDDPHYYAQVAGSLLRHGDAMHYLEFVEDEHKSSKQERPAANAREQAHAQHALAGVAGPTFTVEVCARAETAANEIAGNAGNKGPATGEPGQTAGSPLAAEKIASDARQSCSPAEAFHLSADYYKGDRSMRESGYDISFRFGPFGGSTHHYAPVCLNSFLYKAETDLEKIATMLGEPDEARQWKQRALARRVAMNKLMWHPGKEMFFDYDLTAGRQSDYHFAAAFYPLWAGLATPEQARALERRLPLLERSGGIATSDRVTGVQWDAPYGWAPVELFVVEGLRNYRFSADADRISRKFVSMVNENFHRDGTIREKYNVVTRSTEANVTAGYKDNVVGFGWTNGVVLEFLAALDPDGS